MLEKLAHYYGKQRIDQTKFPNFLCIGAQKAGTTWLYENLRCHPELFLPEERVLNYFDQHFGSSLRDYYQHFENGTDLIKGEVMPDYGLLPWWKIKWLRRVQPDLKLLFIVRDPIDRAWSHARMSYGTLHHRELSTVSSKEFIYHFRNPLSINKGNYLKILTKWKKYYPNSAFCILFYDDIESNSEELLNQVFSFLGVSNMECFTNFQTNNRINTGPTYEIPADCLAYLKKFYRRDIMKLRKVLGPKVDTWIQLYYA